MIADDGHSALHLSAIQGYASIVEYLIKQRADIDCISKDGNTPLMWAAHQGNLATVKVTHQILNAITEFNDRLFFADFGQTWCRCVTGKQKTPRLCETNEQSAKPPDLRTHRQSEGCAGCASRIESICFSHQVCLFLTSSLSV